MSKSHSDSTSVKKTSEVARVARVNVTLVAGCGQRQKAPLDDAWIHLARERARGDAESAASGFYVICVLAAIAIGFLIAL